MTYAIHHSSFITHHSFKKKAIRNFEKKLRFAFSFMREKTTFAPQF
jgi:hypothetical protein